MKAAALPVLFLMSAALAWSLPKVDGRISAGEYRRSIPVLDGSATLYYDVDGEGGMYLAVRAATTGWVGLGLGAGVMNGAHIFMGFVKDGVSVFSEQIGEGHSHRESPDKSADSFAVGQQDGMTTIEFHVPAGKLPIVGTTISYIVAFSGSADVTTYHDDNREGGVIDLSAPDPGPAAASPGPSP